MLQSRRLIVALGACLVGALLVNAQDENVVPGKPAAPAFKTTKDQASYAIGLNIGRSLKQDGLNLNTELLVQGLRDAFSNANPKLTDAQARAALEALDREMRQAMIEKMKVEGEKNKKDGDAFLAANKKKPGVTTLPSGLQYSVIKSGKGATPKANDVVRTHYHGTFIDGKMFDSTIERGEPAMFNVGEVIKGWSEALQKMKVGDKWRIYVPSDLAYGPQGSPPVIAPNAVLIFDLELLSVEPQQ